MKLLREHTMNIGLAHPDIVDEVAFDPEYDEIVLIINAMEQSWDDGASVVEQLKEKIAQYVKFALAGQLVAEFPEHKEKRVRLQINCTVVPGAQILEFIDQVEAVLVASKMRIVINHIQAQ
ncbi:MAG: DUF6572 domain-containing protein [Pseudomonadota bacterium]